MMKILTRKLSQVSLLLSAGLLLAACGSGDSAGTDTNLMTLKITDAPVDEAAAVVVEFSAVTFKSADGEDVSFDLDPAKSINLLALQGSESQALVEDVEIPAGDYNQIRLAVNAVEGVRDSYIIIGDNEYELEVPSGSQNGLKLNTPFTVAQGTVGMTVANENSVYTIDFDLRKSVVNPVGQPDTYYLKPVLRLVQNINTGTISGTVDSQLLVGADCSDQDPLTGNSVYVFAGENFVPDDINVTDPDTAHVTTTFVNYNDQTGVYNYEVGFLSAGDYTLALSCNADIDSSETDDDVKFYTASNVSVDAGENTEHNIN